MSKLIKAGTVIGCVLACTGVAIAGNIEKIPSEVKITKTSPVFAGKVTSPNDACEADRTVVLHAVQPDETVGNDKTDADGKWKIHFQGEGVVDYFARVKRRSEGTAGTTFVCKAAISEVVTAP